MKNQSLAASVLAVGMALTSASNVLANDTDKRREKIFLARAVFLKAWAKSLPPL